jgi:hypothetical protein
MKQLIKKVFIFDRFTVYEMFIYTMYIYFLIFVFINLKPNIYNLFCLFVYVLITSKIIIDKCNNKFRYIYKNIFLVVYAINCCIAYYLMYTYKKIIFKSKFLTFIVMMLPYIYFFCIRIYQIIFNCHRSYVIDLLPFKPSFIQNNY